MILSTRTTLLARIFVAAGLSTVAGCGDEDSSNTAKTAAGGAGQGGSAGSAGSAAAGGSGGTSGTSGSSGTAGNAGVAGSAGQSGAGGSSSVVICDPVTGNGNTDQPLLYCQDSGPVGPAPGCGTIAGMGGTLSCYTPGTSNTPPGTCLSQDDPALLSLLTRGCGAIATQVTSAPDCRMSQLNDATSTLSCCYSTEFTGTCRARPFLVLGQQRAAALRRSDWI